MNIQMILRRRPILTLTAALVAASACTNPAPSPTGAPSCALSDLKITRFPLDGINGRDFLINNYVDLDPSSPDIADFRGRTGARARTYDGHQGIDIDIPSFREMDDGRAVIHAVTAGVVEQVIDDQPDRNVTCAGRWNVVRVRHANGFAVLYGHIQRGSARVRPGQPVAPGTPLAIVGSAGCSTQPHLHLEVRDCAGRAVETLREAGVWRNPPLDEPSSAVMDVMLVDGDVPSVAEIKDPAPDPTVIEPDGTLGAGISLAARGDDLITATLVAPDGASSAQYVLLDDHGARRYGHWYPRFALAIGASPGRWTVEIRINGMLAATRAVTVAAAREPPANERPGPAVNPRARTSPPRRTARDHRRSGSPPPPRESRSPPGALAPPAPARTGLRHVGGVVRVERAAVAVACQASPAIGIDAHNTPVPGVARIRRSDTPGTGCGGAANAGWVTRPTIFWGVVTPTLPGCCLAARAISSTVSSAQTIGAELIAS